MWTAAAFFVGLFIGYGLCCLMGCAWSWKKDDAVEKAKQDLKNGKIAVARLN